MKTRLVMKEGRTYLECLPGEERLQSEQDALDLVAVCVESGVDRLLLHASCLTEDFYRLKTGLAGAILQKFINYHIRVAAVIPVELATQGHFGEMVLETNRGDEFRVFQTSALAEQWLIGG